MWLSRTRKFDEPTVLDAAMQHFWTAGYGASSVRTLGAVMGLGSASLYHAFGDKRALFEQCLDRYLNANMRARIARLEENLPPYQAIEGFLHEIVEHSLASRRGCMLVNTALDASPDGAEIADIVSERLAELEQFFLRCTSAGQRDGSIAPEQDPQDLARLLLTTVVGLRVLARGRPDRALLEGAARQAMAVLKKTDCNKLHG